MKIFKNFLSEEIFKICYKDLVTKLMSESWSYTAVKWAEPRVLNGVTGSVLSSTVSEEVYKLLYDKFSSALDISKFNNIRMEYYIWQPNSGLALHNDAVYGMASTIYLNENWNVDYGGIFMWKESENDDMFNAISPLKNMMILNDNHQYHMVTSISPLSPDLRSTIQVWFT
jgi:Rps23 Pro-64 3,4-dihydroxylase Tpa1-like proline 4-hydroxylase